VRERALEAAPRLDRRADDHELGAALVRDARDLVAEQTMPRSDDLAPHAGAVRPRDGCGRVEPVAQYAQLFVESCVERQLALDEERRHEHDARAAVRGKSAGEVERVLRFLPFEEGHDDRPVADGARHAGQPPSAAMEAAKVRESHRTNG
jgi:hypothetical protein